MTAPTQIGRPKGAVTAFRKQRLAKVRLATRELECLLLELRKLSPAWYRAFIEEGPSMTGFRALYYLARLARSADSP